MGRHQEVGPKGTPDARHPLLLAEFPREGRPFPFSFFSILWRPWAFEVQAARCPRSQPRGRIVRMSMVLRPQSARPPRTHRCTRTEDCAWGRALLHGPDPIAPRLLSLRRNVGPRSHEASWMMLARTPMPEISTSTRSPGAIHNGGTLRDPTPAGVPVAIKSPGRCSVSLLKYEMMNGML